MEQYLLSLIVFLPLVGAAVILCLPKQKDTAIKWTATFFSFVVFVLCVMLYAGFDPMASGMQFMIRRPWIPAIGVNYYMGVDGLSMPLVFLTGLLTLVSVLYSWIIKERPKEYFAFFLLLSTGMFGTFVALDFFLFYMFWEITLVPMYFLIGIWGGPKREYAAIKFFLYTLVGSVAMLLAILACYFNVEPHTFDMLAMTAKHPFAALPIAQAIVFWAFFLGFAIKVPIFPFHTWLPLAHVEAPTAGSIILAGVLLKMGTYGLVRVSLPMFPEASADYVNVLALLAVINIVYGSLVALAQTDLKKLVAYSSIGHMGFVVLGVAAAAKGIDPMVTGAARIALLNAKATALNGATLQMFNHGIVTGGLFLLVGVIYERAHHRNIDGFGGLGVKVPIYTGIMIFTCLASLGLPGLCGFIGEFLTLMGAFSLVKCVTILSMVGVVVTAAYFLWMIQRVFLGPFNEKYAALTDMNKLEIWCMVPLMALMVLIGVYPNPLLTPINTAMREVLRLMGF